MRKEEINIAKLQQDVKHWASSKQGQQTLHQAIERAVDITTRLQQARQVSPESLHKPFTV